MPTKRRRVTRTPTSDPMADWLQSGAAIPHTPANEAAVRRVFERGIANEVGGRVAPWLCSFARARLMAWGLPDPWDSI